MTASQIFSGTKQRKTSFASWSDLRTCLMRLMPQPHTDATRADVPTPDTPPVTADNAILDVSLLHECFGDDDAGIAEGLELFRIAMQADMESLAEAMGRKSDIEIKHIAYRMMGAARFVGGSSLASASEALELFAAKRSWPEINQCWALLLSASQDVTTEIRRRQGTSSGPFQVLGRNDMLDTFKNVLIADDDALMRAAYKSALQRVGYTVQVAQDGEEATHIVESGDIDLLILDILMPRKEGLETLIEMKERCPQLTVIAISAGGSRGETDFLALARKFGADGTLRKPFSPKALLSLMTELASGPQTKIEQSR